MASRSTTNIYANTNTLCISLMSREVACFGEEALAGVHEGQAHFIVL